ncbi:hypothetical protein V1478_013475, partial [Vespula squamosa]
MRSVLIRIRDLTITTGDNIVILGTSYASGRKDLRTKTDRGGLAAVKWTDCNVGCLRSFPLFAYLSTRKVPVLERGE